MGACVSSLHKPSAMKVRLSFGCNRKPDKHLVIPPSPVKESPQIINDNVAVKPQWPPLHSTAKPRDFGSKEETFYDSQPWLESDCEDDFMSVNGEFTPSRGNTPVHHNFTAGAPPMKGGAPSISDHESCITPKKKKRLSELFEEGLIEKHEVDEKEGNEKMAAVNGGGLKAKRERWVEAVQVNSCLPGLLSSCRPVTTTTDTQQAQVRRK
ncbi:uncharacterized protein At3g27210 [Lactuca sativa]|uniref:Uncharacterized protein n=1 Tax=Lactuca sativa TaxID=4236 RepID=A0A9R1WBE0_LACSA|nr:uncharacterized protein At3g27210 [Lactuca sativa]KAJ0220698.1 hypothetical protein LSAT_V11C200084640 [Lactuca sativa]